MSVFFNAGGKIRELSGIYLGGGNGKVLNIKEVYVGKNGKPELVWRKGPGKRFVCVGENCAYYSVDGESWIPMTGLDNGRYAAVAYGNGMFVCMKNDLDSYVYTSVDGESWVKHIDYTLRYSYIDDIVFNGKVFVAARRNAFYSTNGIDWENGNGYTGQQNSGSGYGGFYGGLCYGNGRFVSVGKLPLSPFIPTISYSDNGIDWKDGDLSAVDESCLTGATRFGCVVYKDDDAGVPAGFYAFDEYYGRLFYSLDGIKWGLYTAPFSTIKSLSDLSYHGGYIVGCGRGGKTVRMPFVHKTTGEKTWNFAQSALGTEDLTRLTYGKDRWVCVGAGGKSYYSKDNGETWTPMKGITGTELLYNVTYGG